MGRAPKWEGPENLARGAVNRLGAKSGDRIIEVGFGELAVLNPRAPELVRGQFEGEFIGNRE
jgi:hypothetical protein